MNELRELRYASIEKEESQGALKDMISGRLVYPEDIMTWVIAAAPA